MLRRLSLLTLAAASLAACGETADAPPAADGLCAQASAKLSACFPEQPAPAACHGGTAQQVVDASCEELAALDTKADGGWMCFWAPWLCLGDSAPASYTIFVGTSRCGADLGGFSDCTFYYSSPCTEVVLSKDGAELARGFSSQHGSVRFEVDAPGDYTVTVLDREGAPATQIKGIFEYQFGPAEERITVSEKETRVGFDLPTDSEEQVKQCAPVSVDLTVQDGSGARVDSKLVEWEWFVRFLQADGTVGVLRPFSIHPDATGEDDYVNRTTFHRIFKGEHLVEFIRMDIPSFEQRNNPDYERLLSRYAARSVDPVPVPFTLDLDAIPAGARLSYALVDPLRE